MLTLFDDDTQDNLALRVLFQLPSTKGASRCRNIAITRFDLTESRFDLGDRYGLFSTVMAKSHCVGIHLERLARLTTC